MTEPQALRRGSWLAVLWLLVVAGLVWHQVVFWRAARLDSDVIALLPAESQDDVLRQASQRLADNATRQVVVALGAADWTDTLSATQAFAQHIAASNVGLELASLDADAFDTALDFYRAQRSALLTDAQRERLRTMSTDTASRAALARLYAPGPSAGLTRWQDDPLGLWSEWWQARAGHGAQLRDGWLAVEREGRHWSLLRFEQSGGAFRLDGERRLQDALDAASAAATATIAPRDLRVLQGGVPLHAEAAAVQASAEVATIGLGSLLTVIVLMWIAFRGPRPILLVSSSLLIGCAAGLSATALCFGQVHLLTLVFGASLVGVAEDYGIHYFAARQGDPQRAPHVLMRHLMPGMLLALITSVLAYVALGAAPFPGLRQMALFSAVGLTAAFITAVLWFPWLDRRAPRSSALGRRIASTLASWPRLHGTTGILFVLGLLLLAAIGWWRITPDDSLRSLQNSPPALIEQQTRLGQLLGLPSPAQFYLVQGRDAEEVLQREETLTTRLRVEVDAGRLAGWRAVSDWVPSLQRQQANRALVGPLEAAARARAAELLDEPGHDDGALALPLHVSDWFNLAVSEPLKPQWLEAPDGSVASLVLLEGLGPQSDLAAMQTLATGLDGVRWVDRSATISQLLRHYREMIGGLLLLGYVAVAIALFVRYRRQAWRALLPTALAAVLSVAILGLMGEPLQLFSVLAQLLLLGIGVDYGIFLLEHRDDPSSWLAVSIGAASTWLAFGLLGLSATPALRSFGLTLMFGIALVWLLSPLFRAPSGATPPRDR